MDMDGRTSDFDAGFRRTSGGGAPAPAEDRLGSNPRAAPFRLCASGRVISSAGTRYSTVTWGIHSHPQGSWEGVNETMFPTHLLNAQVSSRVHPTSSRRRLRTGCGPRPRLPGPRLLVAGTDGPSSDPHPAKPRRCGHLHRPRSVPKANIQISRTWRMARADMFALNVLDVLLLSVKVISRDFPSGSG